LFLSLLHGSFPEAGDGEGEQVFSWGEALLSRVENDPSHEIPSCQRGEGLQSTPVAASEIGGAFHLDADDSTIRSLHHKIHLVPFGEYVPLREEFPLLAKIVGNLVPDDFDPGKEFTLLEMESKPVKLGPLVCFEDTLGDLARCFASLGAQAFVVVTNDGWFNESAGSLQHLRNALFRCVENNLPMIRVANTGVTCAIDRHGVVREVLRSPSGSTFEPGILFSKISVPQTPAPTLYARYGEIFSISCLVLSAIVAGISLIRLSRRKISPRPNDSDPKISTP